MTLPDLRRSALALIAASVPFFGLVEGASAVEMAPDGYGQVLIYPYYTVRGGDEGFNTLISIGNSTPRVKSVRLRFHEAREGAPVGDFNIYVDASSVWTGAVFATADGAGLATLDKSCATPVLSGDVSKPTPFTDSAYRSGPGDVSLDRTREGYFEVIEIGDYGSPYSIDAGYIARAANHQTYPFPLDCHKVTQDNGSQAVAPTGGLYGSAMVISVLRGIDFSYAATALAHFTDVAPKAANYGMLDPGVPSLTGASPPVSVVVDSAGRTIRSVWNRGIDSVSAVLMAERLDGEFVLDIGTRSASSWLVAMPTKWYYVHAGLAPSAPFNAAYTANGACEHVVDLSQAGVMHDREARSAGPSYVGMEQPQYTGSLCYAGQSVDFNGGTLVSSAAQYASLQYGDDNAKSAGPTTIFQDGWMSLPFVPPDTMGALVDPLMQHATVAGSTTIVGADGAVTTQPSATYYGLPAIGIGLSGYFNGLLTDSLGRGVLSSYISATALHRQGRIQ